MRRIIGGALSGLGATVVMSLLMLAGKTLGLIHEEPPREIAKRAEQAVGVHKEDDAFGLTWIVAHFGYGTGCGVVYSIIRRLLPGGAMVSGTVFGLLVWGVSYLGIMPALNLYPWPDEDTESRAQAMIAAHVVYGATLGKLSES
jgi:uncharacterized membrane protein YagU involved in acid resistance